MKKLKVTALLLAVIAFVCSFSGCSDKAKYKAELYNVDEKFIRTDFAENNRISGSLYKNDDSSSSNSYFEVEDAPKTRTFIVRNKETYDEIFFADEYLVDFDNEMLIVYTCTDLYRGENYELDKITVGEENLKVYYKMHMSLWRQIKSVLTGPLYACAPFQRYYALKLKKPI